jgi:hypothetical protein
MGIRLQHAVTGIRIAEGDTVITFREEVYTLTGIEAPRHPGSTGRVILTRPCTHSPADHERIYWCRGIEQAAYYPAVIDAEIVDV